jgi:hypothetical protein
MAVPAVGDSTLIETFASVVAPPATGGATRAYTDDPAREYTGADTIPEKPVSHEIFARFWVTPVRTDVVP